LREAGYVAAEHSYLGYYFGSPETPAIVDRLCADPQLDLLPRATNLQWATYLYAELLDWHCGVFSPEEVVQLVGQVEVAR